MLTTAYINMWLCTTLDDSKHACFESADANLPPAAKFSVKFRVVGVDSRRALEQRAPRIHTTW